MSKKDTSIASTLPTSYRLLQQWSWVVAFFLLCGFIYERNWNRYRTDLHYLQERKKSLEHHILQAENDHKTLSEKLASREDWAWRELILKEHLGMVGEKETKVQFQSTSLH